MPNKEQITQAVYRYIDMMSTSDIDGLAALYAAGATMEDPVGGKVLVGRDVIHLYYARFANLKATAKLMTLRVSGDEAAFHFQLIADFGDGRGALMVDPIDVMVFDNEGKISSMKAYWSKDEAIWLPNI